MKSDTSPTRRLTRSTTDTKLAGVSGGLGAYFDVDPVLFRIGFAVTTLLSGAGLVAYVAMLFLVPKDTEAATVVAMHPVAA